MWFKNKKKLNYYLRFILIFFLVVWIKMLFFVAFEAPKQPDESNGRVYSLAFKHGTVYVNLTEDVLFCGSLIITVVLLATIIIDKKWSESKDEY